MDLEERAEELKWRIERLASWYLDKFGNRLQGIILNAELYIRSPEQRSELRERMLGAYSEIAAFYKQIPFDDLQCDEDLAPLFVNRRMLPELTREIDEFLQNPNENTCWGLVHRAQSIQDVGSLLQETVFAYIDELKQIPGYEDYSVKLGEGKVL